jgi:hypothetical protein
MDLETIDKLLFIYINSRSLRAHRGEQEWEKKDFKTLFHDLLLNIEDNIIESDQVIEDIEE